MAGSVQPLTQHHMLNGETMDPRSRFKLVNDNSVLRLDLRKLEGVGNVLNFTHPRLGTLPRRSRLIHRRLGGGRRTHEFTRRQLGKQKCFGRGIWGRLQGGEWRMGEAWGRFVDCSPSIGE